MSHLDNTQSFLKLQVPKGELGSTARYLYELFRLRAQAKRMKNDRVVRALSGLIYCVHLRYKVVS